MEKEYYQYLNEVWNECKIAAGEDKEKTKIFFDKAASPHYYWKTAQGDSTPSDSYGRQRTPNNNPATEKQKKAAFVISHDKINNKWVSNDKFNNLPCPIDDLTIDQASDFIEKYGK